MKNIMIFALFCAWGASAASAYSFKIKVDLSEDPEKGEVSLDVPRGAKKAAERYFRLAETTHPDLLSHGFAVMPNQPKAVDKDVEYVVRRAKDRKSFVLMVVNRKNENLTAEVELGNGKMREPVYRRVYSPDGGKSWTTIAWQPPRSADLCPWTVEVPAKTVQTVTISVR